MTGQIELITRNRSQQTLVFNNSYDCNSYTGQSLKLNFCMWLLFTFQKKSLPLAVSSYNLVINLNEQFEHQSIYSFDTIQRIVAFPNDFKKIP